MRAKRDAARSFFSPSALVEKSGIDAYTKNTCVRSPGFTLTLKGSYGLVIKVFLKIIFPAVETASDYHIQLKDSGWLL